MIAHRRNFINVTASHLWFTAVDDETFVVLGCEEDFLALGRCHVLQSAHFWFADILVVGQNMILGEHFAWDDVEPRVDIIESSLKICGKH